MIRPRIYMTRQEALSHSEREMERVGNLCSPLSREICCEIKIDAPIEVLDSVGLLMKSNTAQSTNICKHQSR